MADEELTCALVTSADKLMMNLKVEQNMFFITAFANLCDIGMILACPLSLEPTLALAHRGMKSHFQVITRNILLFSFTLSCSSFICC